jgi:hypothetical protein
VPVIVIVTVELGVLAATATVRLELPPGLIVGWLKVLVKLLEVGLIVAIKLTGLEKPLIA